MTPNDLLQLMPMLVIAATAILIMLVLAFKRSHLAALILALTGIACAFFAVTVYAQHPFLFREITSLVVMDGFSLFYIGLILSAAFAVAVLSYGYLKTHSDRPEEYYVLMLTATLGAMVIVASSHLVSFFLGLETLSVSLFALIAYTHTKSRHIDSREQARGTINIRIARESVFTHISERGPLPSCAAQGNLPCEHGEPGTRLRVREAPTALPEEGATRAPGIEAGIKYLILSAASMSFLLFGMAFIYARVGTMEFPLIADGMSALGGDPFLLTGTVMLTVGIGFKLAIVPFHMWTPDVYEGAPAPVTAFIATVSKGAVFAVLLRYFVDIDLLEQSELFTIFGVIAVASMFAGNLLALFQTNVKRLLAYSSIAHLGYLLVAFLSAGPQRMTAVAYYLAAYFVTTLGAFGVVTVMSGDNDEADALDDYRGLFTRRPGLAVAFTLMLLSLAGIPLTAGFMGKFFVMAAGIESALFFLILSFVVNSAIGLFYYLRVIAVVFQPVRPPEEQPLKLSPASGVIIAILVVLLIWWGVYPSWLLDIILRMTTSGGT